MSTATTKKWVTKLATEPVWSHSDIRAFIRYIARNDFDLSLVENKTVMLTEEQTKKGYDYLTRYRSRLIKKNPVFEKWDANNFDRFEYRFKVMALDSPVRTDFYPAWTVVMRDGSTWDYAISAWVSGSDSSGNIYSISNL